MASSRAPRNEVLLGCSTLILLLIATLAFGLDHVGRFCLFAAPAIVLATALRSGMFQFTFGQHDLTRSSDPRGFWSAAVIALAISALGLWQFVAGLVTTQS